ncbi:MAG: tetratricopeptide repeat protein [Myxococcales bacterium]|nr:tetratricopeptide repeat protein [Myxococcales bacterium]MCB9644591.1 tetratricopeptide repeat protein [Myxococcales bacterium]
MPSRIFSVRFVRLFGVFSVLGLSLFLAAQVHAVNSYEQENLNKAFRFLARWQPDAAEPLLKPILARYPKDQVLLRTMARLRYLQGRYQDAKKLYEASDTKERLGGDSTYQSLVSTIKITKTYKYLETKHFRIGYPQGSQEAAIAHYLGDALELAYTRLGKIFGYHPPDKVRVDLLSEALELADMSPLTQADIIRTGTIALCKYNRIMLTSPRSLVKGYRWLDTAVHEFTHLLINRVTDGVPIWLHEGLARYGETLWRQDIPSKLSPYSESLLALALKENKLVPFEKMHPSMAKLPSQEMAAQAYAQVYTVILYLVHLKGQSAIKQALQKISKDTKVPVAVGETAGMPFEKFLVAWEGYMREQKLQYIAGLMPKKHIIKGHEPKKSKEQKKRERNLWYKPTTSKELGKRYLRLGEMMRRFGRYQAALFEYRKAQHYLKDRDPGLQNKMALSLMALRKYEEVITTLKPSLRLYPSNVTTFVHLGRAYYHMQHLKEARKAFEEANQINPFHPTIHKYLARIYQSLGQVSLQKRERQIMATLLRSE